MNDQTNPPLLFRLPQQPDELDGLLRRFFQAEIPAPWPAWSPPEVMTLLPSQARRRPWLAVRRRLVLAASVALLLVGYLGLARTFPEPGDRVVAPIRPEVGSRLPLPGKQAGALRAFPPQTVPVPNRGPARLWEQHQGKRILIQLELLPKSRP